MSDREVFDAFAAAWAGLRAKKYDYQRPDEDAARAERVIDRYLHRLRTSGGEPLRGAMVELLAEGLLASDSNPLGPDDAIPLWGRMREPRGAAEVRDLAMLAAPHAGAEGGERDGSP